MKDAQQPAHRKLSNQDEVAAYLDVDRRVLEAWRARGEGPPFVRLNGRSIRYRIADVEAWLKDRTVTPGARRNGQAAGADDDFTPPELEA